MPTCHLIFGDPQLRLAGAQRRRPGAEQLPVVLTPVGPRTEAGGEVIRPRLDLPHLLAEVAVRDRGHDHDLAPLGRVGLELRFRRLLEATERAVVELLLVRVCLEGATALRTPHRDHPPLRARTPHEPVRSRARTTWRPGARELLSSSPFPSP